MDNLRSNECYLSDRLPDFPTFGGQVAAAGFQSTGDVLSSEKPSIDRPGAWTDHC
jgi:hypothetical protein